MLDLPSDVAHHHAALSQVYAKQTLFFVGGYPKSGTTWLQILLNAHPEVSCIGEGHLANQLVPLLCQGIAQHHAMVQDKNTTVLQELPGFPLLSDGQVNYLLASAIAMLLMAPPKAASARAIGEKTPDNHMFFPQLAALFPTARFINIVRDGRDCAVSAWFHNRRVDPDYQARDFTTLDEEIEPHADHWSGVVGACLDWCETRPAQCLLVRYEDLVANTTHELRKIFAFLGVTASDAVVARCREDGAFERLSGGRVAGQEDSNSLFRRGLPGDWHNHFSTADNIRYFAIAGDVLARLGYR
jgi:hypothetical protein